MPSGDIVASRYRLLEKRGEGGMGVVWEAVDEQTQQRVAVKLLHPQVCRLVDLRRFRSEFAVIQGLRHPHIVSVLDGGATPDGVPYLVMELVEGSSLRELLGRGAGAGSGPQLPVHQAVGILIQVARALDRIHAARIVHRDVKPSNIIITPDGTAKLSDFGVAKRLDATTDLTRSGEILGTVTYLSPEQARGAELDGRSDLYSLGVVLYEVLVGRPPFVAPDPLSVVLQHLNDPPLPPRRLVDGIPPGLELINLRLLEKEPECRFSTAAELLEVLEPYGEPRDWRGVRAGGLPPAPSVSMPRLVGRERELGVLRRALAEARGGNGQVVQLYL